MYLGKLGLYRQCGEKNHCLLDYVCLCTVQFLQKIYREDLDEMMDEADFLLNKNRETAKEKVRWDV